MVGRPRPATILACVIWLICGAYAAGFAYRGWVPHDEGTIGQTAERVLSGQVPHRDFDETYTGGLTYLHAAAMRVFGVNLRTPRLLVFAFFMAFLAAIYAIARRLSTEIGAVMTMAVAAVWSLPNYFVSLPSWYNLFLATFGVLAFFRYLETERRWWLALAGFCGGLSVLAKISGLFYLAGGLAFLTYLEIDRRPHDAEPSAFRLVLTLPVVAALVALWSMLLARGFTIESFLLFVPATAVAVFVVWREWAAGFGSVPARARRLAIMTWPFLVGAAVPILAFVLFYWREHALADLMRGVFVAPQRRLVDPVEAGMQPPNLLTVGLSLPYLLLLMTGWWQTQRRATAWTPSAAVALAVLLVFGSLGLVYQAVWAMMRALPLVSTVAGLWFLAKRPHDIPGDHRRQALFLLVTMAALTSLVQFPFAAPIYFLYAAPMTFLAIVAIVFSRRGAPIALHGCLAGFVVLFALCFMNRSYVWSVGFGYTPYRADATLEIERAGLRVPVADKVTYETVVRLVQQHAAGGTIYAGPDCPEVYFLAGLQNPTRALFDFLGTPLDERSMAALLAARPIRAAVINTRPSFSPPLDPAAVAVIERRFPSVQQIGAFIVRFE